MRKFVTAFLVLISAFASAVLTEIPCYGNDSYIHVDIMNPDGSYMMWKDGEIGEIEDELTFYPSIIGYDDPDPKDRSVSYQIIYDDGSDDRGRLEEGEGVSVNRNCTVRFFITDNINNTYDQSRDYMVKNTRSKSALAHLKSILLSVISI